MSIELRKGRGLCYIPYVVEGRGRRVSSSDHKQAGLALTSRNGRATSFVATPVPVLGHKAKTTLPTSTNQPP